MAHDFLQPFLSGGDGGFQPLKKVTKGWPREGMLTAGLD